MRLPADGADETIAAAVGAGITVFDTARAYGDEPGGNERMLARALRAAGVRAARIVTKGGMTRPSGAWVADGRAKSIRADCEASLAALDGLPIALYLLHAPDPRTPWRTSLRALARLVDDGLVRAVGVANVTRDQLDEAVAIAPVSAVQVAVSAFDVRAVRGGLLRRCEELGVGVIAHSPLGSARRAPSLARNDALAEIAQEVGGTAAEVALAWLLALAPTVVAIPGARRPETVRSAARATKLTLGAEQGERLDRAFDVVRAPHKRPARDGEVVVVMGIPGAGKTRVAQRFDGYARLNRDERAGSLRALADALEEELAAGATRIVLDNTYLSRASRSHVLDAARRHGLPARCVWLDTPLAQAQVNLVERLLDVFGSLPGPDELRARARSRPGLLAPTSQMRALRELEPPSDDEGFAAVERVTFVREARDGSAGFFVAASALELPGWQAAIPANSGAPCLVFDWRPDGAPEDLAAAVELVTAHTGRAPDAAVCPHGGGPPVCWCRPPLPGLALAFARSHDVDASRSILVGASAAHRALAAALGATFADVTRVSG